jgi:UDP-N-acetylmuramoyl-tripeptide--D-alanyl-D-alanine ligase
MKIDKLYEFFQLYPAVSTDSRNVRENSIFFALRGNNFDGNSFAASALQSGARLAVVDNQEFITDERYFVVEDVLLALQELSAFHRRKLNIPIIAVTGTNGKTTTKELLAAVLGIHKKVEFTRGNLNNHIGVPLTLLTMNKETEIGIVEMGANHPGEIKFLCRLADPDFGIVTNIGKAHLEGFGGFEGVIITKSELYRYLEGKNGTVFMNNDNLLLKSVVGDRLKVITYGLTGAAFLHGKTIQNPPFLTMEVHFPVKNVIINTHLTGDYNFENVMAVITAGLHFGIEEERIVEAVEGYFPDNHRSQLIRKGSNTIVMDAYNANPSSMKASLNNFLQLQSQRKVVILGDMLELGASSLSEHQQIIDMLVEIPECQVFLVGEIFPQTAKPANYGTFSTAGDLMLFLSENPLKETSILIKGSHGIGLEKVISAIS